MFLKPILCPIATSTKFSPGFIFLDRKLKQTLWILIFPMFAIPTKIYHVTAQHVSVIWLKKDLIVLTKTL